MPPVLPFYALYLSASEMSLEKIGKYLFSGPAAKLGKKADITATGSGGK